MTREVAAQGGAQRPGLEVLGLKVGEAVRWQAAHSQRWHPATVTGRGADGSVALHDRRGGARNVPVERVEVARRGPRGGSGWEPLTARADRTVQLALDTTW